MSNNERLKKYIETECVNCKNRTTDLCDIRIIKTDRTICTKCVYYEKDNEPQGFKKQLIRTAKQNKPLMKF